MTIEGFPYPFMVIIMGIIVIVYIMIIYLCHDMVKHNGIGKFIKYPSYHDIPIIYTVPIL